MHDEPIAEAAGLRLRIGVLRRYKRAADFVRLLKREIGTSGAAFYYHLNGQRIAAAPTQEQYEALLGLPKGWLCHGGGEDIRTLREAAEAMERGENTHPTVTLILTRLSDRQKEKA